MIKRAAITETAINYKVQISAGIILMIILLRLGAGGFNPTYFVVAGDEFVQTEETPVEVVVNEGAGYDGQFFFAYALEPFSTEQKVNGITIDYPSYRNQRIIYPLLSWMLAMGYPSLIPFTMILINALALLGLVYLFSLFAKEAEKSQWNAFLPLLICGLWMSLSRDLAENVEVFFVVLSMYVFYKRKLLLFVLSAILAILSREPSLLLLFFISLSWGIRILLSKEKTALSKVIRIAGLVFPFLMFLAWKLYLNQVYAAESFISGSGNFALPFKGMYLGLLHNYQQIHNPKTLIELIFWLGLFSWNIYLIVLSGKCLKFNFTSDFFRSTLSICWLTTTVFTATYGVSIYIDDWAFARVLGTYNLMSFVLLLFSSKNGLPKTFIVFSLSLLLLTWGRLIIRV